MTTNAKPRATSYYKDFYRLPKETFIGVYGSQRYESCKTGAVLIKHYVDAGINPAIRPVSDAMQVGFYYAKDFIQLTLEVLESRGLKTM